MKKKTEYYVNNKEFLEAITVYRNRVIAAKEDGKDRPRVPNYIGECFLKIATHTYLAAVLPDVAMNRQSGYFKKGLARQIGWRSPP